jgi:hypothetical protein
MDRRAAMGSGVHRKGDGNVVRDVGWEVTTIRLCGSVMLSPNRTSIDTADDSRFASHTWLVIARSEATKQSSSLSGLDCFALLAMTASFELSTVGGAGKRKWRDRHVNKSACINIISNIS